MGLVETLSDEKTQGNARSKAEGEQQLRRHPRYGPCSVALIAVGACGLLLAGCGGEASSATHRSSEARAMRRNVLGPERLAGSEPARSRWWSYRSRGRGGGPAARDGRDPRCCKGCQIVRSVASAPGPHSIRRAVGCRRVRIRRNGRRAGATRLRAGARPLDTSGDTVSPGDYVGQARQVMANLDVALVAAGARLVDVVKTTVYVASDGRPDLVNVWESCATRSVITIRRARSSASACWATAISSSKSRRSPRYPGRDAASRGRCFQSPLDCFKVAVDLTATEADGERLDEAQRWGVARCR